MSELEIALKNAGLLDTVKECAQELGTSVDEAIRLTATHVTKVLRIQPYTTEFYDLACASITGNRKAPYLKFKEAVEAETGCEVDFPTVLLYAISGKTSISLVSNSEFSDIDEAIGYAHGWRSSCDYLKADQPKPEVASKLSAASTEVVDAVCARLTGKANASYSKLKEEAEKKVGAELDIIDVLLYAWSGKTSISMMSRNELADIEAYIDQVLGES